MLSACWLAAACGPPPPAGDDIRFDWTLTPMPPRVGAAVLTFRVLDSSEQPVRGAHLRVEGHMSHPGMQPVLAPARERQDGVYEAHLDFTMIGDWIVLVSGSLPNGAAVRHRIDVAGVGPAG